jgi:hypothetical protein
MDLRAEYADNYSGYAKTANWYGHSAYPHFHRGDVLGHSMGGGSRDWFVQSRYFITPATHVELSYERIRHYQGVQPAIGFPGERHSKLSAGVTGWLTSSWRAEARASTDRVTNQGGVPGSSGSDFSGYLAVSRQVNTFSDMGQ